MRRTSPDGSGSWFTLSELLKVQENCEFPDESVKIKDVKVHSVGPAVLTISTIKEIT